MSTDIKPGQVWAASADPEDTYRVIEVRDGHVWSENRYGGHAVLSAAFFPNGRHLVTDATPAPLDPAKVKAGATVTLERDGGRLPDQEVMVVSETGMGYTTAILRGGVQVYITGPDAWTLTAHQPAPEPEYAWGGFGSGVVDGLRVPGYVSHTGYFYSPDAESPRGRSEVADFRPLVVIDPAAAREKIAEGVRAKLGGPLDAWYDVSDVVLAAFGIEATP